MLESIEKDNKTISKAYRGKELVWELHQCMLKVDHLFAGSSGINLRFYPNNAKVTITINRADGSEKKYNIDGVMGEYYLGTDTLQSGDRVIITAEAIGWKSARVRQFIS